MKKIETIYQRLYSSYPPIDTSLEYGTPFQLLIATILSAQCTDEVVNRTTKHLFIEYSEPEQLARADIKKIKKIIRPTGYYSLKANRIKKTSRRLVNVYNSKVPDNMEDLYDKGELFFQCIHKDNLRSGSNLSNLKKCQGT